VNVNEILEKYREEEIGLELNCKEDVERT